MSAVWPIAGLLAFCGVLWVIMKLMELRKKDAAVVAGGGACAGAETPRVGRREWILDHGSEARFFGVLEEAVAEVFGAGKCRVFVQVPLCRLVEVERGLSAGDRQRWKNKIDRKTVDYVVCEMPTLKPLLAVELDGTSHDAAKRKERDGLVERVLETAGVRLVRFDRRGREWGVGEVGERVREVVGRGHACAKPQACHPGKRA